VITFVDITDHRKVEDALRQSESQLLQQKRLVDLSRAPIFVWDFDGGIVEWNRGSEELYGFTREEAAGKRKDKMLQTRVPGYSFDDVRAALLRDGNWSGELQQTAKDGRKLVVESRLQLDGIEGRKLVLESTRDITERRAWEERQKLLLGELVHRVKNTLSVVQSIARQTLRNAESLESFSERFGGRLSALATAHGLLVQSEWRGADFGALARSQLEPYISENPDRLRMDGEPITLPADLATPFGLVLHELATNAAKYGSLADPKGTVHLSWTTQSRNGKRMFRVVWREKDGPPLPQQGRKGFGSALIESGIPNASVVREFKPDGLFCKIELPLEEVLNYGVSPSS
jgi:two-component system CheB/CheR fusion protein